MSKNPPPEQETVEARWNRVRRMPGVVIHRPRTPEPFVPAIRVAPGTTLDDLLADEDDDADRDDE